MTSRAQNASISTQNKGQNKKITKVNQLSFTKFFNFISLKYKGEDSHPKKSKTHTILKK